MEPQHNDMKWTILDVLNMDCWRLILDQLAIRDVVGSERVSRAWQRVTLHYLAVTRRTVHLYNDGNFFYRKHTYDSRHTIEIRNPEYLKSAVKKLGPRYVSLAACDVDQRKVATISLQCPNLETVALRLIDPSKKYKLQNLRNCKKLRKIVLHSCELVDENLNEIIASDVLEEFSVNGAILLTGAFLANLRKHLKTLSFNYCHRLRMPHILSAMYYLRELTRFELDNTSNDNLRLVHLLIEQTPKLEHLTLMRYFETMDLRDLQSAVCRLRALRTLHVYWNHSVTDEWVLAIAQSCPALRSVDVGGCAKVTGRGVVELCRARPTLAKLGVNRLSITNDELQACCQYCPNLEMLDVTMCSRLSTGLPGRLSWPRARPLTLKLHGTRVTRKSKTQYYDGLLLNWDKPPAGYRCQH